MWPGQRHGIGTWKIEVAVRMQSPGGGDLLLIAAPPSLSVTPAVGVRRYAARAPRLPYASDLVFQPVVRLRGASCQPSTLRQDRGRLPSRIHRWFKFGNESRGNGSLCIAREVPGVTVAGPSPCSVPSTLSSPCYSKGITVGVSDGMLAASRDECGNAKPSIGLHLTSWRAVCA